MRFVGGSGRAAIALAVGLAIVAPVTSPAAPRSTVSSITHRPEQVGQCFSTTVRHVGHRLKDGTTGEEVAGSGSAIAFADGHLNMEYNQVAAMDRSRRGDPVRLCVRSLPAHCPAGDTRGITYRVRDLRTGLRWVSADNTHTCGGA